MKYIDSEKLISEIEKLKQENEISSDKEYAQYELDVAGGYDCAIKDVYSIIKFLQQEQLDNWNDEYREDELLTRFAFYTYKDEYDVLYLSNVFVEETSRNKGFGTKILAAAEKVAEIIGAINIRLKVKQDSPANAWYRKRGYGYMAFEGDYDWLEKTLEYLKPKQDQPEVDLEKEIVLEWKKCKPTDEGMGLETANIVNEQFDYIARHFWNMGYNARKV